MSITNAASDDLSDFQQATVTTARALADDADLEILFEGDHPFYTHKKMTLPVTGDVSDLRAFSDMQALFHRYHNHQIHQENASDIFEVQAVMDDVEKLRCAAIGATEMNGVKNNLKHLYQKELAEIPSGQIDASQALSFFLQEALLSVDLPDDIETASSVFREMLKNDVKDLVSSIHHQDAFQQKLRHILDGFGTGHGVEDAVFEAGEQKEIGSSEDNAPEAENNTQQDEVAESDSIAAPALQTGTGETHDDMGKRVDEASHDTANPEPGGSPSGEAVVQAESYKFFTNAHDEVLIPRQYLSLEELHELRAQLDRKMADQSKVVRRLAQKLKRKLLSKLNRTWMYNEDEGYIDGTRLARIVIDPFQSLPLKRESQDTLTDTVVTLLIDNSGSMRGRPIATAAMTADILTQTLELCGIKTEVIGFTTASWRGGKSLEKWQKQGKPLAPGRLNDLRHIIYKKADQPWRGARLGFGMMLKENLLKENIDGESLLWACHRLIKRPEKRRILIVVSDGAPVDDATLSQNKSGYLDRHLRDVITAIESTPSVELRAIGIGHDVGRYYQKSATIQTADDLGETLLKEMERLFNV